MPHLFLIGALGLTPAAHAAAPPTIQLDFAGTLLDLVQWAARLYDVPFVLGNAEALQARTVSVLSSRPVPHAQGWDLFQSALHEGGFAVVFVGHWAHVVPIADVASQPLEVRVGPPDMDVEPALTMPVPRRPTADPAWEAPNAS